MGLVVLAEIVVDVIYSRQDDCKTQVWFSSVAFLRVLYIATPLYECLNSTRNLIVRNSATDKALNLNFVK